MWSVVSASQSEPETYWRQSIPIETNRRPIISLFESVFRSDCVSADTLGSDFWLLMNYFTTGFINYTHQWISIIKATHRKWQKNFGCNWVRLSLDIGYHFQFKTRRALWIMHSTPWVGLSCSRCQQSHQSSLERHPTSGLKTPNQRILYLRSIIELNYLNWKFEGFFRHCSGLLLERMIRKAIVCQ